MSKKRINVALDGPSGVGKSSTANEIAKKYNLQHLDTGAMYRAIGLYLDQHEISGQDEEALKQALKQIKLEMPFDGRVLLNGKDVSDKIRTPEVSLLASKYSSLTAVREKLVALQQQITEQGGYIVDGRDICDVVLPDAPVKIYLDASAEARAKRRWLQDQEKGKDVSYEDVYHDIVARDEQDRNRAVSPLKISDQATVIDTSDLDFDQSVSAIAALIDQVTKKEGVV